MCKTSLNKYIEKKRGSLASVKIQPRDGTNMRRYHHFNECMYTKPHKDELSKRVMLKIYEVRWLTWPRSKRVVASPSERYPNMWTLLLRKKSINKKEMDVSR